MTEIEHFGVVSEVGFGGLLTEIEANETNYEKREALVYEALFVAKKFKYKCGIRFDNTDNPPWPVVCIELPCGFGEVSWHCPPYTTPFTEYDTKEKYARCQRFRDLMVSHRNSQRVILNGIADKKEEEKEEATTK